MPVVLIGRLLRPILIGLLSGLLIAGASIAPPFRAAAPVAAATTLIREAGSNRYSTAASVSRHYFSAGVSVAYVVNGGRYAEGLAAGAAAVRHGPVLLVKRDHIPTVTRNELKRLRPDRIVIVGSGGQVSTSVRRSLRAIAPVSRRTGHSRYGTAVDVSQARFNPGVKLAYIANPNKVAWALGAAPAAHGRGPILFSRAGSLPAVTATELRRINPDRIIIAGGTDVISTAVANQLATIATVRRESGATRFSTAAKTSRRHFSSRVSTVWVVNGKALPYAMSAGAATKGHGPLLLVNRHSIPPSTAREILRLTPTRIIVVGGSDQVSSAVGRALGNHAPVANDDQMPIAQDCSRLFWVVRNDSDADGDHLTISSITNQPDHGTASVVRHGRAIRYRPSASYNGSDLLTYRVGDGRSGTDTANVGINVRAVGDADSDGVSDGCDAFVLDPDNGTTASASFTLDFGGTVNNATLLQDLGFDGLMYNGNGSYASLYDASNVTVSGGRLTVDAVPEGDAIDHENRQQYAFQRAFLPNGTNFFVSGRVCAPYPSVPYQAVGVFFGLGQQDDYIKAVVDVKRDTSSVHDVREVSGRGVGLSRRADPDIADAACVDLRLAVKAATHRYVPKYSIDGGVHWRDFGGNDAGRTVPASWLDGRPLAAGIIATSQGLRSPEFPATWDSLSVTP